MTLRRPGLVAALLIGLCFARYDHAFATVPMRVVQQYLNARNALQAALKQSCVTPEEYAELEGMVQEARAAIGEQIAADQKKWQAGALRDTSGKTTPQEDRLQTEIEDLRAWSVELSGLLWKLYRKAGCPMPVTPPPPPPQPPPPAPPAPPAPPPSKGVGQRPHHRQTNCPKCANEAADLNKAVDALLAAQDSNAPGQEQLFNNMENLAEALNACEKTCSTRVASIMTKPAAIAAIGGGAALAAVAIARARGGSDASIGAGASPPSSFLPFAGTLTGVMQLVTDANTCAGSDADYNETGIVSIGSDRTGTLQLQAAFARMYRIALDSSNSFSDSETLSFLGTSVPGKATGTFAFVSKSSATLTLQETTTYGSCSNTYRGQLK